MDSGDKIRVLKIIKREVNVSIVTDTVTKRESVKVDQILVKITLKVTHKITTSIIGTRAHIVKHKMGQRSNTLSKWLANP